MLILEWREDFTSHKEVGGVVFESRRRVPSFYLWRCSFTLFNTWLRDTHFALKTHSHLSCQADIVGSFPNKLNRDSLQYILTMISTCLSERLLLRASRSQLKVCRRVNILYWREQANALNSALNVSSIQETVSGSLFLETLTHCKFPPHPCQCKFPNTAAAAATAPPRRSNPSL